jgi:hypothetical protein
MKYSENVADQFNPRSQKMGPFKKLLHPQVSDLPVIAVTKYCHPATKAY